MDARVNESELVLLPLGGAGEIGMNFNAYGCGEPDDRKWIVVDCGVMFGRETGTPGVDVILPDIRYLAGQSGNVLAIVLTHAHEDHIGAVARLWPQLRCPIYATPFTARLVHEKLAEAGLSERARISVVPLGGRIRLGPFDIEFISITHSIPEPNALAIRTPFGVVVHTGDWKLDSDPLIGEATDSRAFIALGEEGTLALVCDSTNALVAGESGSESRVRQSLIDLVGTLSGRVAVTAFASNVARLQTAGLAAHRHGRQLALVGRSMDRIVEAARATGYLADFPATVDLKRAAGLPPNRILYLCTGSQGEPRAALARIAAGEHSDVALGPGDSVIFSSRIIPGNDRAIFELQNKLAGLGVEVITERDHFVHVSGHPAREELAQMYRWVRPRIAVPVHGELRHMTEHARLARSLQVPQAIVLQNGHMLRLAPGRAEIIDETPSGRLHLDGNVMVEEGRGYARARATLAYAGLAAVTIPLDNKGRVAGDPALVLEGIPDEVQETIRSALAATLDRLDGKRMDEQDLKDRTRIAIRRAAHAHWGKKPVTRVDVIWV